ncbi:MAG: UDP-N-acetylmuramoyl-L-alanine--D-glutamate ligase [Candidatus Macondimonas sp.]
MKPSVHPATVPETVVVGLGVTGLSVARYLHHQGEPFRVVDTRAHPPQLAALQTSCPGVTVHCGPLSAASFAGASRILLSPGVAPQEPALTQARARGVPVEGDIALFARAARAPIAAITGSNGKSTVTALLGEMARAAGLRVGVGGNLGTPALDLLADDIDLYVLELSSFQLETTETLNARVATVLNLSEDHIDRHGSLAAYAATKARIFRAAPDREPPLRVLNAEDARVVAMIAPGEPARWFALASEDPGHYRVISRQGRRWLAAGSEPLLPVTELALVGEHHQANALAALAMADALALPRAAALQALRQFRGLPHRTQLIAEVGGVRFIDDSKGTNVGATVAALRGVPGPLVLIAGGQGKGQDFSALRPWVAGKVRAAILIGQDGGELATALAGTTAIVRASALDEAVRLAARHARPGDAVLLSPACASLDMFRDYHHRGEVFAAAVRELTP